MIKIFFFSFTIPSGNHPKISLIFCLKFFEHARNLQHGLQTEIYEYIKKLHSTCYPEHNDGYSVKQPYSINNVTLRQFGFALREEAPDIRLNK